MLHNNSEGWGAYRLPVLTTAARCGSGGLASNYVATRVDLSRTLCRNPNTSYIVEVSGDSMADSGIVDGGYIVVDPGREARHDDIVLVHLDGEIMCKRLFQRDGAICLLSDNAAYAPIVINEFNTLVVLAVVVSWFHTQQRLVTI